MAATNPNTILLKGEPNRRERNAGGVITPGDLIDLEMGTAADADVVRHATAEGSARLRWFAVENDIAGDDLDHNYAATEVVQFNACRPGDEVYANVAASHNVNIGTLLVSNGSGRLTTASGDSAGIVDSAIVAVSLEDKTTTASDFRVRVQIV